MDLKTFWLGWRRDILRVAAFCAAALALGVLINHARGRAHRAREQLVGLLPRGLGGLPEGLGEDDADSSAAPRVPGERWTYHAPVARGQWVWVRDRAGSVTVEPTRGESLEVRAEKTFGHSDPSSVRVVAVPGNDGITICALWGSGDNVCGPGEAYKQRSVSHNDVRVHFTVRLPRGVAVGATTVTGTVRVVGASAHVILNPAAGGGTARRLEAVVAQAFRRQGWSVELSRTEAPGHGVELAARAVDDGARRIVAVGGDGTVHDVANGMLRRRSTALLG